MSSNLKRKSQFDKHDLALERGSLLRAETSTARWHSPSPQPEVDPTTADTARSNATECIKEEEEGEEEAYSSTEETIDENFGAVIRAKPTVLEQCCSWKLLSYASVATIIATVVLLVVVLIMPWEGQGKGSAGSGAEEMNEGRREFVVQRAMEEVKQIEQAYLKMCGKQENIASTTDSGMKTEDYDYSKGYPGGSVPADGAAAEYEYEEEEKSGSTEGIPSGSGSNHQVHNPPAQSSPSKKDKPKSSRSPSQSHHGHGSRRSAASLALPSISRYRSSVSQFESLLHFPHVERPAKAFAATRRLLESKEVSFDTEAMLERMTAFPDKVAVVTGGGKLNAAWSGLFSSSSASTEPASRTFSAVMANHLLWATEYGYHMLYYRFISPQKHYHVRTTRGVEAAVCKAPSGWKAADWCQLYALLYSMTLVSPTQLMAAEAELQLSTDCEEDMMVTGDEFNSDEKDELGAVPESACPVYEYFLFADPSILLVANLSLPQILSQYVLPSNSDPASLPSIFFASSSATFSRVSPSTSLLFIRNTRAARRLLRSFLNADDAMRSVKRAVRTQSAAHMVAMKATPTEASKYKLQKQEAQEKCEQQGGSVSECMKQSLSTPFVRVGHGPAGEEVAKSEVAQRYEGRMKMVREVQKENEKKGDAEKMCEKRRNVLLNTANFFEMKLMGRNLKVFPSA